jgi:hypothetical protein
MISDRKYKKFLTKEEKDRNIMDWQIFYLNNLDIFNTEYLHLKSKYFQKQVINICWENDISFINASRGLSKSYTIGNFAIDISLLLPNINVGIASLTIGQANKIIDEKIDKIFTSPTNHHASDVLAKIREDGYITFSKDKLTDGKIVNFGNGSKIFAVSSGESGRGTRLNVIIVDECALIKKTQYDANLEPMLEPYNFKGIIFEPKQFFLTSSRTKDNWCWGKLLEIVSRHYKNDTGIKYGFFAGDILTSVANKIHTKKQFLSRRENTSEFEFMQEYFNIWQGEPDGGLYTFDDFRKLQKLDDAFIPLRGEDVLFGKEQEYDFGYDENVVRVLSCDIAVSNGEDTDNTIIILGSINLDTGMKKVEYIKSIHGENSINQARIMKRLFYQFKCDYCIIDLKGIGNAIYDILTTPIEDNDFNENYSAWTITNEKELLFVSNSVIEDKKTRTLYDNAENVIVPYVGTLESNSLMHIGVKQALKNKDIMFLIDSYDKDFNESERDKNAKWLAMNSKDRANQLAPFIETNLMIEEAVMLKYEYRNGHIRVFERNRNDYKDRYMTLAMFNFLCDKLIFKENKYKINKNSSDTSRWSFLAR